MTPGGSSLCGDLFVPTTTIMEIAAGQPAFDRAGAFTFIYDGGSSGFQQIEVPAGGPPSPPPFSVQVVATGCNPCKVGDFAKLHLHVTNPGAARYVEVKAGSHFPDGVTSFVFLGRYVELLIPAGESDIDIPGLTLPPGLPFGTYTIEGATNTDW